MDRAYIEALYLLCSFEKFYALDAFIGLSDWTLNGEFIGIHKSTVNPKDPPNISP